MADSDVQLQPDGSGKFVDTASLSGGPGTVQRQRVSIGDDGTYAAHAGVVNTSPSATAYGLVVRPLNYNFCLTVTVTTTPVLSGATVTQSPVIDLGDLTSGGPSYSVWRVLASSDVAGTLHIQQSADNSSWDDSTVTAVSGGTPVNEEDLIVTRYLRVQYVNGPANQSFFRLFARLVASR